MKLRMTTTMTCLGVREEHGENFPYSYQSGNRKVKRRSQCEMLNVAGLLSSCTSSSLESGPGVEPRLPVAACAAAGFNPMSKEEPLLLVVISVASVAASWRARGADPQHNFASSMYTASAPADVIAREIKSGTRFDSSGSGQVARCQVRGGLGTFGGNGGNCGPWGEAGGKWSV